MIIVRPLPAVNSALVMKVLRFLAVGFAGMRD
jgi:hypothetical protein